MAEHLTIQAGCKALFQPQALWSGTSKVSSKSLLPHLLRCRSKAFIRSPTAKWGSTVFRRTMAMARKKRLEVFELKACGFLCCGMLWWFLSFCNLCGPWPTDMKLCCVCVKTCCFFCLHSQLVLHFFRTSCSHFRA